MRQKLLLDLRKAFWLIPGFYMLGSIFLALFMFYADSYYASVLKNLFPEELLVGTERAEAILGALANSFLTMIFIFTSSVMVILSAYLGEYSPRTIQNYLSEPPTLHVMGVFSGGFLYSILQLLFMRETDADEALISPAIGVLIAILAMILFVYFLHHAGKAIQLSNLIRKLSRETLRSMEENDQTASKRVRADISQSDKELLTAAPKQITAAAAGYIQLIDYELLVEFAAKQNVIIKIEQKIGDYITENQVLFSIWCGDIDQAGRDHIQRLVLIGEERATLQDVEYALQKMVEITLKGLSPGINDPNTSIFSIHEIGKILNRMARASLFSRYYYDRHKQLRLIIRTQEFSDVLYFTFYQIRHYARDDLSVLAAILDALILIAEGNNAEVGDLVWEFCSYVLQGFNQKVLQKLDEKFILTKVEHLAKVTGYTDEVDKMWSDYLCG